METNLTTNKSLLAWLDEKVELFITCHIVPPEYNELPRRKAAGNIGSSNTFYSLHSDLHYRIFLSHCPCCCTAT